MPTRKRKEREAKAKQREAESGKILANPPAHIVPRLHKPSQITENMSIKGTPLNRVGAKFDEEGNLIKHESPEGLGANLERHEDRETTAQDLRERYANIWGNRGAARTIANGEGLKIRAIQKYIKDYPL